MTMYCRRVSGGFFQLTRERRTVNTHSMGKSICVTGRPFCGIIAGGWKYPGKADMKIEKALTFRASSIGDCLMGKYLLENIHAQFPNARLGIVVASRGAMIRDLFATYPWLEVIEANRRSPRSLFYLWRNFRNSDLVMTQYAGKLGGRFGLA